MPENFNKESFAKKAMETKKTPLEYWSKEIDPAIMAGDEWVDKENDIGNEAEENKKLEEGIMHNSAIFMHPIHDVSYGKD